MKIKIRVEKKNKFLEIPISKEEIREIYDENWDSIMYYDEKYNKLSKDKKKTYKNLASLQKKLMYLIHDVLDEGVYYTMEKGKFVKSKKPHYNKKPSWGSLK